MTELLRALPAWFRSWRKPAGTWTFEDYPVLVERNGERDEMPEDLRIRARIARWPTGPSGFGPNETAARADLARSFADHERRPRPGTRVPVEFAASDRIDAYGDWAFDAIEAITGIRPFFVSDASSLADFAGDDAEMRLFADRARERYGVEIGDIEDGPLVTVLDRIAATGRGPSSP